jgi:L-rhamnose mutarotase
LKSRVRSIPFFSFTEKPFTQLIKLRMPRYCLALDLKDDPALIAEYEKYHQKIRPEIAESITGAGITQMEIYRIGNRLFMIMETTDDFSFEEKAAADAANPKVQEWENLMWHYQQALPMAKEGEKWMLMKNIFQLS